MAQTANIPERAEAVRRQTLTILKSLRERGKAFGLPEPPAGLEQYQRKLEDNTYQVLVVGEAKRGKSTFVNALIGRDILPTDVDIATSQVFRICPADREAYRIRFEDDSQQTITAADLPRFGSQVMADAVGVPRLDQIIRWIEVDGPIRFLPPNVRILDTPGLGALYAAHAEITHRFVPHADAVIFVLDSQAPIGDPEIKFIEKLLGATNNIFFIQTKIDQFRKEAWQEIQKRNQDILRQRFKDRLVDTRVWPISSTNLQKAAETGDDDFLIVSRHKELAAGLNAFLFRVAGWSRSTAAIVVAEHAHAQSRKILAARLDGFVEESKLKRTETQMRAAEHRKQFDADWGERGRKRRELMEAIHKATNLGRQRMRQTLQPGGELETEFRTRIEACPDMANLENVAKILPQELKDSALKVWREVEMTTQAKCSELLREFSHLIESRGLPRTDEQQHEFTLIPSAPELRYGGAEKWVATLRNILFAGGAAHFLVPAVVAIALPFWVVPAIAVLAVGIPTVIVQQRQQLKVAKQELLRHLAEALQRLRNHILFDVDLASGRSNAVDECFGAIEKSLAEQIGKLAVQKLKDTDDEINRLAEAANLDDEQRKIRAEEIRRQFTEWDGIGQAIKVVQAKLKELDRCVAPTPQA